MIKEISNFSIKQISDTNSSLFYKGENCHCTLSGLDLEKQFQIDDKYHLLFLTYDCPFEERLNIYLLDNTFKILDKIAVFNIYTSGILTNVKPISEYIIEFDFYTGIKHQLHINLDKKNRFSLNKLFKKYLVLKRIENE